MKKFSEFDGSKWDCKPPKLIRPKIISVESLSINVNHAPALTQSGLKSKLTRAVVHLDVVLKTDIEIPDDCGLFSCGYFYRLTSKKIGFSYFRNITTIIESPFTLPTEFILVRNLPPRIHELNLKFLNPAVYNNYTTCGNSSGNGSAGSSGNP